MIEFAAIVPILQTAAEELLSIYGQRKAYEQGRHDAEIERLQKTLQDIKAAQLAIDHINYLLERGLFDESKDPNNRDNRSAGGELPAIASDQLSDDGLGTDQRPDKEI